MIYRATDCISWVGSILLVSCKPAISLQDSISRKEVLEDLWISEPPSSLYRRISRVPTASGVTFLGEHGSYESISIVWGTGLGILVLYL